MSFTYHIVKDASSMEDAFPLVRQLSPNITQGEYTRYIADMINSNYFQIIMRNDSGKAVAVSGIWIATKLYSGKYLEMDNVVVDQNYRSAGLGKMLYEKCLEIAKENECEVIMLDAYVENERAHVFYMEKGFIKRGFHFIKKL